MEKRFKFKSLNVYASDEWMADSTKRYRKVFDKAEISYLRCELALYNKLFDEEDWSGKAMLKCIELSTNKEICALETNITVSKNDNIVFVRDGWGVENAGGFWKKGKYKWLAYIDGVEVGGHEIFIEEIGLVTNYTNPYFSIESIKLYEGDYNGWEQQEKKYLTTFNKSTTRYVWAEMKFKLHTNEPINYELKVNFLDDAGLLKGTVNRLSFVEGGKQGLVYIEDFGWGNNNASSWKDDKYSVEIVFMDVLIGAVTFNCDNFEVEGVPQLIKTIEDTISVNSSNISNNTGNIIENNEKNLDELLADLNGMIGLESVKKSIQENITYLNFTKLRKEKGFDDGSNLSLHAVFTGNPGTGKTTVVKKLGKIYQKMGLLSKGHVYEVDRSVLVGEYIGQTAPKVKKAIDEARGGILFIDEAYSLARSGDDSKDFGKEVIEILLKEMSDGKGDLAVIVAGYPKEMNTFLESNPGLKSRFTQYFNFDDYLPEELFAIAQYACETKQVTLNDEAQNYLKEKLTEAYRRRDNSFGNARFVHGIIEEAKQELGLRLMKLPNIAELAKEDFSLITLPDLKEVFVSSNHKKLKLAVNDKDLSLALEELNALVGMDNIKQDVSELVKLIRFYNETGKDVVNKFSIHSVFTGNPGTGKTTLARIIAKIYKALGVLERGHVIEVDREGLVAGYVGQTAIKTKERVDAAMGGILFIDEAYALAGSSDNDFGKEAVEVILKQMEDKRGQFGVIVAGYPDNMHRFIETNPGLKSRFDKTYVFNDYNTNELLTIAKSLFASENLYLNEAAENELKIYFENLISTKDKFFGNARTVRQAVGSCIKKQHLRMASISNTERTEEVLKTLLLEDVNHLAVSKTEQKPTLGFRFGA